MPLFDHFHPPLSVERHWESFHARWAAAIADSLNANLPREYFAEAQVHVGSRVEVDIATFERRTEERESQSMGGSGSATATATVEALPWAPPASAFKIPAVFPDSIEVLVISTVAGPTLVAAVELISPGNKDRGETRRAFAAKAAAYLQQGIGLLIVDIVTDRLANLHNELISLLDTRDEFLISPDSLYCVSYRPARRNDTDEIEVWPFTLEVARPLPIVPLPLDKQLVVPLDLDATYNESCVNSRIGRSRQ